MAALHVAARLRLIVVPTILALVAATFLAPPVEWLKGRGWPPGLAAILVLGTALVAMGSAIAAFAPRVADDFGRLDLSVTGGVDKVQRWIVDSPLPLSGEHVRDAIDRVQEQARAGVDELAGPVLAGAVAVVEVVAGAILTLVVLFFLLKDGSRVWAWLVGLAPASRRRDIDAMGRRSWRALGGFLRGQTLVALFDAVLIGLALAIIGIPLVLPLAVLTFFGAYVPIIGAAVAALVAVLVAIVSEGLVAALLVLAAIVVVQQLEGNVLGPVVLGRATNVHPLAILLGVAAGGVLGGIVGAMLAAPLVAVGGALLGYVRETQPRDAGALGLEPTNTPGPTARDG